MKINTNYTFRIIIEPDEKGTFHGYVPALSGCHTFGATIEETRKNLKDAISVHVSSLIADGENVPRDNSFESFETVTRKELEMNYV
ncbi:MAG: type II toxin-antitoxin system HicB family antitoxin [Patescibacteria group bacterium]